MRLRSTTDWGLWAKGSKGTVDRVEEYLGLRTEGRGVTLADKI